MKTVKLASTNQPRNKVIEATTRPDKKIAFRYCSGIPAMVASAAQFWAIRFTAFGTPTQILARDVVARKNIIRRIRHIKGNKTRRKPAISRTTRLNRPIFALLSLRILIADQKPRALREKPPFPTPG